MTRQEQERELWQRAACAALQVIVVRNGSAQEGGFAQDWAYSAGLAADALVLEYQKRRFAHYEKGWDRAAPGGDWTAETILEGNAGAGGDRARAAYLKALTEKGELLAPLPDWRDIAHEPLFVIESNECTPHPLSTATRRFRRLFNVIRRLQRELAEARGL